MHAQKRRNRKLIYDRDVLRESLLAWAAVYPTTQPLTIGDAARGLGVSKFVAGSLIEQLRAENKWPWPKALNLAQKRQLARSNGRPIDSR